MRRPTTRFANCTGIRRCPDSTNTIPTIMATPIARITKNWNFVPSLQIAAPWAGSRETTDAKIRIDIPLPMPRWVMSSPSHITMAVPAVQTSTMSAARHKLKPGMKSMPCGSSAEPDEAAGALVQREHEPGRLHEREGDGEVPRPLRDLLLADLTLLLPLLELGDHDTEQLHDDRCRDVRHDPEEEDRDVRDRAAGEEVEESDHAAVVGTLLQRLDGREVDVRHGKVRARTCRRPRSRA